MEANCLIFLLLILLSVVLSPLLLARSLEYPQRIRVVSVFGTFACLLACLIVLCLEANFLIFLLLTSSFIDCLLCYWPAPSSIHRGLEWSQSLNRLSVWLFFVLCLCVSKFSHFSSPHPPFKVLSPLLLARSPEYPQRIRVASVFEFFVWLSDCSLLVCLEANFLIFLLLTSSFIVLSPLLLARSPEYPQRIRVASVFEPSVCLPWTPSLLPYLIEKAENNQTVQRLRPL